MYLSAEQRSSEAALRDAAALGRELRGQDLAIVSMTADVARIDFFRAARPARDPRPPGPRHRTRGVRVPRPDRGADHGDHRPRGASRARHLVAQDRPPARAAVKGAARARVDRRRGARGRPRHGGSRAGSTARARSRGTARRPGCCARAVFWATRRRSWTRRWRSIPRTRRRSSISPRCASRRSVWTRPTALVENGDGGGQEPAPRAAAGGDSALSSRSSRRGAAALEAALLLNPDPVLTHYYFGLIDERQGNEAAAIEHFKQSLSRLLVNRPA